MNAINHRSWTGNVVKYKHAYCYRGLAQQHNDEVKIQRFFSEWQDCGAYQQVVQHLVEVIVVKKRIKIR